MYTRSWSLATLYPCSWSLLNQYLSYELQTIFHLLPCNYPNVSTYQQDWAKYVHFFVIRFCDKCVIRCTIHHITEFCLNFIITYACLIHIARGKFITSDILNLIFFWPPPLNKKCKILKIWKVTSVTPITSHFY